MFIVSLATASSGHLSLKTLVTAYENYSRKRPAPVTQPRSQGISFYEIGRGTPSNFIKGKALGTRLPVTYLTGGFLRPGGVRFARAATVVFFKVTHSAAVWFSCRNISLLMYIDVSCPFQVGL